MEGLRSRSLYGIGFRDLPFASTALYVKSLSGIGKPAAAHSCKTLLGTVASSAPNKEGTKQMVDGAYACGQDMHMAIAAFVHFLDISDKVHAVFALIVEPSDKR